MNRKRIVFNLLLFAGLVALCSALWLMRAPKPSPPPSVTGLASAAITDITVNTPDDVIALARDRDGARWRLSAPVRARVDANRVAALLAFADAVPERRMARDAVAETVSGMDDPSLVLRFNDQAPIAIGAEGPRPGTRYVRTAHALLLVAVGELADQPLGWTHWLAPGLIGRDEQLTRLILPRLTLIRSGTGGWQVAPADVDRGADYAQATIDAWHHSRALGVEPMDASRERIARITLNFADRPARYLDLIERRPELILRDADLGVDYHLAAVQAGPLLDMDHPDLLRQGRATDLAPSAIPLTPGGGAGPTETHPPADN
ncbi:hypothetical protein [Salinisphaera sp. T31B1]|uniref:hypothetical protein n=1 Tax=Salinisphaera sp. T31B1 TaxID=727963 RepID=UPI00333EFA5D